MKANARRRRAIATRAPIGESLERRWLPTLTLAPLAGPTPTQPITWLGTHVFNRPLVDVLNSQSGPEPSSTIHYHCMIDYGDGSAPIAFDFDDGGTSADYIFCNHDYAARGRYLVQIDLSQFDGSKYIQFATPVTVPLLIVDAPSGFTPVDGGFKQDRDEAAAIATFHDGDPNFDPSMIPVASVGDATEFIGNLGFGTSILSIGGGNYAVVVSWQPPDEGIDDLHATIAWDEPWDYRYDGPNRAMLTSPQDVAGHLTNTGQLITSAPLGMPIPGDPYDGGLPILLRVTSDDDAVTAADLGDFINWGDGTTFSGNGRESSNIISADPAGGFDLRGGHVYRTPGRYGVIFEVDQDSSGQEFKTEVRGVLIVPDAQPTLEPAMTGIPPAGASRDIPLATFIDPNPAGFAGSYRATIDWGDGLKTVEPPISAVGGARVAVSGEHTYAASGAYSVRITVSDLTPGGVESADASVADSIVVAPGPMSAPPPAPVAITGAIVPDGSMELIGTSLSTTDRALNFAGTVGPGASAVEVLDYGAGASTPTVLGEATADGAGRWAFGSGPLASGRHRFGAVPVSSGGQAAGNAISMTPTGRIDDVLIAPRVTPAGRIVPDGSMRLVGRDLTTTNPGLGLAGSAAGAATVRVIAFPVGGGGPTILGDATPGASGAWSLAGKALPAGRYDLATFAFDANFRIIGASIVVPVGPIADVVVRPPIAGPATVSARSLAPMPTEPTTTPGAAGRSRASGPAARASRAAGVGAGRSG